MIHLPNIVHYKQYPSQKRGVVIHMKKTGCAGHLHDKQDIGDLCVNYSANGGGMLFRWLMCPILSFVCCPGKGSAFTIKKQTKQGYFAA